MEVIYSIYNRHRSPEFQIETSIIEENEQKKVIKKALTKKAYQHIEHIYKNYFKLKDTIIDDRVKLPEILEKKDNFISFEFIEGKNFDKILFEAFLNKNKDEYFKLLDEYFKFLSSSFKIVDKPFIPLETRQIFKNVNLNFLNNEKKCYLISYIDPIFNNIIIKDNSYYLIDNEWTLEGNLPVSFIFFRSLLSFYNKHKFKEILSNETFISINKILKHYEFTDNLIELYYDMEKNFQYYVYGENTINKNNYVRKVQKIDDLQNLVEQKEIEINRKSAWLNTCQEEVKKRDETVRYLQKELEEKEKWVSLSQEEIKKRDDHVYSLSEEMEKKEKCIKERDSKIHSMSDTMRDREKQIDFFQEEVKKRDDNIYSLLHNLEEKKEYITSLTAQLIEKESHINNLSHQLIEVDNNIKIAGTTKAWKLMCFIRRIKEQLFSGNITQKKIFLKWIKNKLLKQPVNEDLELAQFSPITFHPQFFASENRLRLSEEVTEKSCSIKVSENTLYNYRDFLEKKKLDFNNICFYDIILFSIIDWDTRYQRPQHLATGLAQKGHRIFYVSVLLSKNSSYSYREINKNIYEIVLPYDNSVAVYTEEINRAIELLQIAFDSIYSDFSIKESIAFVEFPIWYSLVKYLKDKYNSKVVFDVLDEFSGFSNVHRDINHYQDMMISISDLCISTSKKIFNNLTQKTEVIKTIPNATEFEYFKLLPENNILSNIKKPVIGYYGAIAEWFDTDIIEFTAIAKPEWNIVLIGHTFGSDAEKLKVYKNIYLLGEKPYKELTNYLYRFDVCLIPFKLCDLILSTNPVKFYEYISSGKPVVSTNLPELEPYKDLLYISHTKEEFVENIEVALKENNQEIKKRRIETARNNDWIHRVEELENSIIHIFPKVSIIMVTYNNKEYTELCIENLLEKTAYPNYELIIVDNASCDETKDYLNSLKERKSIIKVIFNENNSGFAKGNNKGISIAEGEYLIFINNDIIVTRGWVTGLLKYLKDPDTGLVGPVTNSIGNESRINYSYRSFEELEDFSERYTLNHNGETLEMDNLAFFCISMRKEMIEKIGLLDEQFEIGMFEDDDYCLRVKKAGYKLLCAEDVFIHHFGSASFNKLTWEQYVNLSSKNLERFEQKWNIKPAAHKFRSGVTGKEPKMTYNDFKAFYKDYQTRKIK